MFGMSKNNNQGQAKSNKIRLRISANGDSKQKKKWQKEVYINDRMEMTQIDQEISPEYTENQNKKVESEASKRAE